MIQNQPSTMPVTNYDKPLKHPYHNKENIVLNCSTLCIEKNEKDRNDITKQRKTRVIKEEDFSKISKQYVLDGQVLRPKSIKYRNDRCQRVAHESPPKSFLSKKQVIKLQYLQKAKVLTPEQSERLRLHRLNGKVTGKSIPRDQYDEEYPEYFNDQNSEEQDEYANQSLARQQSVAVGRFQTMKGEKNYEVLRKNSSMARIQKKNYADRRTEPMIIDRRR